MGNRTIRKDGMNFAGGNNLGYATTYIPEPYEEVDWIERYVPTVRGQGVKRPVIYVAAPLPPGAQFGGFGNNFGSGFGGFPGFR